MDETKIGMKIEAETKDLKTMCETMQTALKEQFAKGLKNVDTQEMYKAADIFKDLTEAKKNVVEACYKTYILEAMEKSEAEGEDEDGEDEDGEDEEKRFYRGRSATTGRYVSRGRGGRRGYDERMGYGEQPPYMDFLERYPREYYRNMDMNGGKMYYSDGSGTNNGSTGGNSDSTRSYNEGYNRGYEDGTRNGSGNHYESRVERYRRGYHEAQAMNSKESQDGKDKRLSELNKYMDELAEDMKVMIKDMSNEERTMLKTKITKLGNLIQ